MNRRIASAFLISVFLLGMGAFPVARAEQYSFVALGDTAYVIPDDYPIYRDLIATINKSAPLFSIHIGDTKGYGECGDDFQLGQKAFFDTFGHPVVYTPGNNEWSDCWKESRGSGDPLAVLKSIRKIFWPESRSLGQNPMAVSRQSDGKAFPAYAENMRWSTEAVSYATVNVVGENNNHFLRNEPLWREFVDREKANVAWISQAFENASNAGHKAIVIAFHSNIFDKKTRLDTGPFEPIVEAIASGAEAFRGQVLVVHGHEHKFIVDRPLREWDNEAKTSIHDNVTRLQVYGWPDMKAVRVTVDTQTPWVFGFEPLFPEISISPEFQD
jgi:hypothetical protein